MRNLREVGRLGRHERRTLEHAAIRWHHCLSPKLSYSALNTQDAWDSASEKCTVVFATAVSVDSLCGRPRAPPRRTAAHWKCGECGWRFQTSPLVCIHVRGREISVTAGRCVPCLKTSEVALSTHSLPSSMNTWDYRARVLSDATRLGVRAHPQPSGTSRYGHHHFYRHPVSCRHPRDQPADNRPARAQAAT